MFIKYKNYLQIQRYFGEGNGNSLKYSCLENPMDGGAQQAVVHGVTKSQTRLCDFTFTFHFHELEKEMATHSSVLAWRIPGMAGPVGCRLWSRTESDMTKVTQQQQQHMYIQQSHNLNIKVQMGLLNTKVQYFLHTELFKTINITISSGSNSKKRHTINVKGIFYIHCS